MIEWLVPLPAVLADARGSLIDHESLMFLMPTLPVLLIVIVLLANTLARRGLLGAAGATVRVTAALDAIAVGLSLGAAAIHFSVIGDHLELDFGYGLFFIALAWFQAIWPQVYLLSRRAAVAAVAAFVNAAAVIVWIVSRTTGLPFGPTPWVAEPVGSLDLFAAAFELCLIGLLLPTLAGHRMPSLGGRLLPAPKAFVLATFGVMTVTLLATVALLGMPEVETAALP